MKFLSKHFAENGKEKLFPNDSLFISNLIDSLLKRNLWSYWKWETPEEKIWPFFITSRSRALFSSSFIIASNEWQKWNITIVTFKQASMLYEPRNYRYSALSEMTHPVQVGCHWYRNFLILTSDIFIFNITSKVIDQKDFNTSLLPRSCLKRISWDREYSYSFFSQKVIITWFSQNKVTF